MREGNSTALLLAILWIDGPKYKVIIQNTIEGPGLEMLIKQKNHVNLYNNETE